MLKNSKWILVLPLRLLVLIFVCLISLSCSNNNVTDDGSNTKLLDPAIARSYLLKHHILTSQIAFEITPPKGAGPGHPYYCFSGLDHNRDEKYVWVDAWSQTVNILNSELMKHAKSAEQIVDLLQKDRGIQKQDIESIYAYPNSSEEIIWFVGLKDYNHYFYFDFQTGKLLMEHVNGRDYKQ